VGEFALAIGDNHPSGSTVASRADEQLTQTLVTSLSLVDVRVLDHFIVAAQRTASFAEMGLL
jgi:DNA repair protein RadC